MRPNRAPGSRERRGRGEVRRRARWRPGAAPLRSVRREWPGARADAERVRHELLRWLEPEIARGVRRQNPGRRSSLGPEVSSRFYRRRPRIINKAPLSSARALAPEAGSISGTAANPTLDIPTHRSVIPAIFIINCLVILYLVPPTVKFWSTVKLSEYCWEMRACQGLILLVLFCPLEGSGNQVG